MTEKKCPVCFAPISAGLLRCPRCGWDFPPASGEVVEAARWLLGRLADARRIWQIRLRSPLTAPIECPNSFIKVVGGRSSTGTAAGGALSGPPVTPQLQLVKRERHCWVNSLGMEFVSIKPGTFWMGAPVDTPNSRSYEGPPHEVVITKPFEIGRYPVTQAQWEMVMGYNPSFFRCPRQPVENISWEEACQFICKLNRREAVNRYRLPTEAEWEYAASSGGRDKSDDDPHLMGCRAWFFANSDNKSQPVGMKIPNSWGLYDMQGNVWEWVYDWFGDYQFMCERDPTGPPEGSDRVIRGGGWGNSYWQCRLFTRSVKGPEFRSAVIGLRLVIDEDLASESLFSVFLGH